MTRATRTRLIPLAILWVVAWLACDKDDPGFGNDDDDDDLPSQSVHIALHDRFSAIATVTFDEDMTVTAEYGEGESFGNSTPEQAVAAGVESEILILGLRADREYSVRVMAAGASGSWTSETTLLTTEPLPTGWPSCEVAVGEPAEFDADEVICTNGWLEGEVEPMIFCVDRAGEPVWWLKHPGGERLLELRALSDGSYAASGDSGSFIAFFDAAGRKTGEYSTIWFEGKTRFVHEWIDVHDVIEITEGPWTGAVAFLTDSSDDYQGEERWGNGVIVFDPRTEEVLWDWAAHGEHGDQQPIDPSLDYDRHGLYVEVGLHQWLHGNALLHGVDDDDRQFFWLSLRAQDWIIKVDVDTDAVLWRFGYEGDFQLVDDLDAAEPAPLDPERWMFQQHAPEWQSRDGSRARFLVFDNGVVRPHGLDPDAYSRVVEFELDEEAMRATIPFEYGSSVPGDEDHFLSVGLGDADMQPGGESVLTNKGGGGDPWITEIRYPQGDKRWQFGCSGTIWFYRVDFYPSLYERTWWYDVER